MKLLTTNKKLDKGISLGYASYGIHLAPYTVSGKNVCPHASKGCAAACLSKSGFGFYPKVQQARIKKTQYFHSSKDAFMRDLMKDIETAIRRSKKNNMIPCFRLNLTSDLPWENIKIDGKTMMEHYPEVQFYDYSKSLNRMVKFLTKDKSWPKNYHLTFSKSETNDEICKVVLAMGGNVACVFRGSLPKKWNGVRVINGVESDTRFLDPKKVIVGLVALGKGVKDDSGFVIDWQ